MCYRQNWLFINQKRRRLPKPKAHRANSSSKAAWLPGHKNVVNPENAANVNDLHMNTSGIGRRLCMYDAQ
ncbi:hypothetical protein SprV_0100478900 [Sparganum proliferum]